MMHRLLAAAARPQPLLAPSRALSVVAARASKAALLRPLQQPQGALRRLVSSAPSRTHSCLVARTVVGGADLKHEPFADRESMISTKYNLASAPSQAAFVERVNGSIRQHVRQHSG